MHTYRYFRPTMNTLHVGVTSLNLKPFGECLTNNNFDAYFLGTLLTFLTFVLYINTFLL